MKTENNKVSAQNILSSGTFLQWIILIAISIVFTISLYPNLVADKKTYDLGDVAEKDIKAPRDFFIEDKDATEEKRNSAMEGILTVYDHDTKLSTQISERIDTAFSDLRTLIQTEKATYRKTVSELFDMNTSGLANLNKRIHDQIWEKKPAFEEKIGIPVSKGGPGCGPGSFSRCYPDLAHHHHGAAAPFAGNQHPSTVFNSAGGKPCFRSVQRHTSFFVSDSDVLCCVRRIRLDQEKREAGEKR